MSVNYDNHVGKSLPFSMKDGRRELSVKDVTRMWKREQRNRYRVRGLPDSVVETVDFVAVCFDQDWKCCICQLGMDPSIEGPSLEVISVEHDPAVSVAREHTRRTVRAAHLRCNHEKAARSDTGRAAKIKRVSKEERIHVARMALKAAGEKLPDGAIQGRGFSKPPRRFKKRPWPKRSLR